MPNVTPPAKRKALPGVRRQPTQARAQATVQTLFKAAAQILEGEGEAALSTNKVAAAAGFSIGTLYQYFPSKEALVQAMAQHGRSLVLAELERRLSAVEQDPLTPHTDPRVFIDQVLAVLVQGFAGGRGWTRSLVRLAWSLEEPQETASAVRGVAERLALFFERIAHPQLQRPSAALMFVLTRSVIGSLRSASLENSPLLQSPALQQALLEMVLALLQIQPQPHAAATQARR